MSAAAAGAALLLEQEREREARERRLNNRGSDQAVYSFKARSEDVGNTIAEFYGDRFRYNDDYEQFEKLQPFDVHEVTKDCLLALFVAGPIIGLILAVLLDWLFGWHIGLVRDPYWGNWSFDWAAFGSWLLVIAVFTMIATAIFDAVRGDHWNTALGFITVRSSTPTIVRIDRYDDDGYRNIDEDVLLKMIAKLEAQFGSEQADIPVATPTQALWTCGYCNQKNPVDKVRCTNCGGEQ